MTSVLTFFVLLGVLVFVHEFGHFITAKLTGVKVLKFSLGFPPSMFSRKWGETEYILSWIPLGGYVKLLGQDPESDEEIPPGDEDRTFSGKPLLSRMAVIAAGPLANFLLAVVVIAGVHIAGCGVRISEIGEVLKDSPAMKAGIETNDLITEIDGVSVWRWDDMRKMIQGKPEQKIALKIMRDGREIHLEIIPELADKKDPFGAPVGLIGILQSGKKVYPGLLDSVYEGLRATYQMTEMVLKTVVMLLTGQVGVKALSGPITIAQASGQSFSMGITSFLFLMAFISINLGVINLLPVPILDGGHLLFFLIEAVIRRPVTGKIREMATLMGMMVLVSLMVLVFYNDISRIVTQGWELKP